MTAPHASHRPADILRVLKNPIVWLLAVSFSMLMLDHSVLITHLLPLLYERGIESQTAVLAASMMGPMQVIGRLAMVAVDKHISQTLRGDLEIRRNTDPNRTDIKLPFRRPERKYSKAPTDEC